MPIRLFIIIALTLLNTSNLFAQVVINEFMASNSGVIFDEDGDDPDWIELWNVGGDAVSLNGWSLSDDPSNVSQWTFPDVSIAPGEFLVVFASEKDRMDSAQALHTNFTLAVEGEYLALADAGGNIVDEYAPMYPNLDVWRGNISFGLDASGERVYFVLPTPGEVNGESVEGFLGPVSVNVERGFYDDPFTVELSAEPGSVIYYTTNGDDPTPENGELYQAPISINTTTILRASAYRDAYQPSDAISHTYIFLDDVLQQERPTGYPSTWGGGQSGDYEMDPDVVDHSDYRDTIRDDLKTIPSLSIVTDQDRLFDRREGIYMFPENKGVEWERAVSVEWIDPSGAPGFQINCGLRIQGGYSRSPGNKKYSFRMLFKRDYGEPTLQFPVFPDSKVEKFNTLTLRGSYNYSWHSSEGGFGSNIGKAEYIRDEFARKTQLALGQPASHGTYVHLYLNGMYWGLYDLVERPDDAFSADHLGGGKDEWDVITGGTRGYNAIQVKAGDQTGFNRLMQMVSRREYESPQGYDEIQDYVNLDSMIDYMLCVYFIGNRDAPTVIGGGGTPWNYYSSYRRTETDGFYYYLWDSEWSLEEPTTNVIEFHRGRDNPALVFQSLRELPEFRMYVADRIQKHFFNDGPLSAEESTARYLALANQIDRAIVGESARWGDKRFSQPRMRDPHWLDEVNRISQTYLPVRSGIVIDQLKTAGLFPSIPAPEFSQRGGLIDSPISLELTSIRQQQYETDDITHYLSLWSYNQDGVDLGTEWREVDYDDSGWDTGRSLLYVESSGLEEAKRTALQLGRRTYYFRKVFTIETDYDLSEAKATLRPFVDDGAVIYINGAEALRFGMPAGNISYNTFANRTVGNATYEGPFEIDASMLRAGKNVIAIEVHQTNANSSDVVFGLEMSTLLPVQVDDAPVPIYYTLDGSDPRLEGGAISSKAVRYQAPIAINSAAQIRARAKSGDEWSAIDDATFLIQSTQDNIAFIRENLKITEVMYNPPRGSEYEYIELYNASGTDSIALSNLIFSNGIDFRFGTNDVLAPQTYGLLTSSLNLSERAQFRVVYGLSDDAVMFGPFDGRLSNNGEQLELRDNTADASIVQFEYDDEGLWPLAADGAGHSLVPKADASLQQENGVLEYPGNWRASGLIGGSPAADGPTIAEGIQLSEFLALSADGDESGDWIEIANAGSDPISLSGYYLSDSGGDLQKWAIPTQQLGSGSIKIFTQTDDFGASDETGFGLSKDGESLYLSYQPTTPGVGRVVDALRFQAQEPGVTFGRVIGGSYWASMAPTQNTANTERAAQLSISELMFHPSDAQDASSNENAEFIELYNASDETIALWNDRGAYRIRGGVDFDIPLGLELAPKSTLVVVGFDPSFNALKQAFFETYQESASGKTIAGPFEGRLANNTDRIRLEKPQIVAEAIDLLAWVLIDEITYFDQSPWPDEADGSGMSLERITRDRAGNDPSAWQAKAPTPGEVIDEVGIEAWSLY
ncbi:MAG: lamin tail domain-containing protein [Candidatus Hinthialibacter antarcticus]|nr:lamin tail domain-containing protein [Candidatus Hinthialibacter antarcticus]